MAKTQPNQFQCCVELLATATDRLDQLINCTRVTKMGMLRASADRTGRAWNQYAAKMHSLLGDRFVGKIGKRCNFGTGRAVPDVVDLYGLDLLLRSGNLLRCRKMVSFTTGNTADSTSITFAEGRRLTQGLEKLAKKPITVAQSILVNERKAGLPISPSLGK
jgi:hypothetical protein